jgi:hypothetical protein
MRNDMIEFVKENKYNSNEGNMKNEWNFEIK